MISVALFDSIAHYHEQGMSRREIARRLKIDPKTVRRNLRKVLAGATEPQRTSPGSKLDRYRERIKARADEGWTAWSIHQELSAESDYDACYELVKKLVARLRVREPKVYERLEHPAGEEAQADFGELMRVMHEGKLVRTWAYLAWWPHSDWRYAEVVLDEAVPTFLTCVQNGIRESGAIPQRFSIDNLGSGVFYKHFQERAYQHEFAKLCTHYGMMPNAVRVRTPTDKGKVERGISSLKAFLKGRKPDTLEDLRALVGSWQRTGNDRPHSNTGRRPNDLIAAERRPELPDFYPVARWREYRLRTDCHVQVLRNFYSAPYTLVGKKLTVRLDTDSVQIYHSLQLVARHTRCHGRGQTITDRSHYPAHKQRSSQQIHRDRIERVRAVGAGAAAFLHGLLQSRDHVHSDAYRALMKLVEANDRGVLDRACTRAAHFGNFSLDALRTIVQRRLYELPLDDLSATATTAAPAIAIVRPLSAYTELFGGFSC